MRLTRYTDYALRVLIYLGLENQQRLVTISEISKRYAISRNHIMKVVFELGQLGYIETVRGKNGGMRLAQASEAINIGRVVRSTETDLAMVECFQPEGQCCLAPVCTLRGAIDEALHAFFGVLDRYTLKDILHPEQHLRELLSLPVRDSTPVQVQKQIDSD